MCSNMANRCASKRPTKRLAYQQMKTMILYAFHQLNDRVQYFIDHAIFQSPEFDFFMICNNRSIDIKVPDYVKVIKRDNLGYDFGAWSEGLLDKDRYKLYDAFIFLNSSILGPYLPPGFAKPWPHRFLDGLKDNIKLFGSTINAFGDPRSAIHVQSFAFCAKKETVEFLISRGIFSTKQFATTFDEAIWHREVRMSREIIAAGWNIGSLMKLYNGIDFTFNTKKAEDCKIKWAHGDMMYSGKVIKEEVMFVKGNRGFSTSLSEQKSCCVE
jgi:hypothetical protein